jgi:transcriptional regulator GlxA family with amidase domain
MRASAELRAALREGETVGRRMIKKLQNGVAISSAVEEVGANASDLRRSAAEHLSRYEHRRHEMRLTFVKAALDEGMTIGELARRLGVSRQLMARFAKEARNGSA